MAQVSFTVANRSHSVACRDGEEPHLLALVERLQRHAPAAMRASAGTSAERTLLLIALMLADELDERDRTPAAPAAAPAAEPPVPAREPELPQDLLDEIAERLEAVAAALEDHGHVA
ncbi:cell division protein ZapA [Sphingomonas desiccabilis]|uniref:Cell division protein ZapA n=1 Tax=Sphingomonas desiccabilis TaxID=429134 RepID=A0A4V1QPU9_9SPHN|nr:cell division protein ZapA [Sphingomonas desiccabilis]MBB3910402.1 cell division protein ZapA [Sphingomonas desiccabilis]RXZ35057.1 cell division protein ZapA [Sphingomonas desiccabilis]